MKKSGRGPTGPRTPQGKARASQNATKHQIFVGRVLPEEEERLSFLYDGTRKEYHLQGVQQCEIGRELAQNLIEGDRDKYAVQEFRKARLLASMDAYDQRHTPLLRYPSPKEKGQEAYSERVRPAFCEMFLTQLKERVQERGPNPDEDLDFLNSIYGDRMTFCGEVIVFHHKMLKLSQRRREEGGKTVPPEHGEYKARILEAVEREINAQEIRAKLERLQDQFEFGSDMLVLPPDAILDRIQRYRTSNIRNRSRLLGALETSRRLGGNT